MTKPGVLFVCLLVAAGCGGGGGGGNTDPTSVNPVSSGDNSVPLVGEFSMVSTTGDPYYGGSDSNTFSPTSVTIQKGGTVTWRNQTGVVHNVTFALTSGAPANIADNATGTFTRTFTTAGTYNFSCTNHSGMSGTIVVK